jgi:hypothetical protein
MFTLRGKKKKKCSERKQWRRCNPSTQTENYLNSLSGGKALDEEERSFFEPRMGYNFRDVKIHSDSNAAKSSQSINALAYTSGNNIVFNQGQYNSGTDSGKRLIAHELTHVVQQHNISIKKIQRQHIQILNNRYVGDLEGSTTNIKEDVLNVIHRMHSLWSMSNTEYNTDYPIVNGMPARSHVRLHPFQIP